jgi:hypothetical protein
MFSSVGKFEARKLIADFDGLLIQIYGRNMTDARITRDEAILAIKSAPSVREAVESLGTARGLQRAA